MDKQEKKTPAEENDQNDNRKGGSFQVTDRRFWAVDSDALERAESHQRQYPSYVEELRVRTETAEKKLRERLDELQAENDAFRSRLNREMERRLQEEKAKFLGEFLEVIDNFERALEAVGAGDGSLEDVRRGLALNLDLFKSRLKSHGLEPLEVLDAEFDPRVAEAVGFVSVDDPARDQTVVEVLQTGYRLGETLLRPAQVKIGRFSE